ncbi:MAG TPA: acyl carrier protein [Caulobacteraceae bacterium]|nr:acyl carrier protein [Caulobacteraceae bacterium]
MARTSSPAEQDLAREREVAGIYAKHLLRADVPVDEDLFTLGADSLMAAGIVLELERTFGVRIPQEVFIEEQSVRRIAAWLGANAASPEPAR